MSTLCGMDRDGQGRDRGVDVFRVIFKHYFCRDCGRFWPYLPRMRAQVREHELTYGHRVVMLSQSIQNR